jgi:RHH-type rel operon transcriptional repressor/antitoxin RelB
MVYSVRFTPDEQKAIEQYASLYGMKTSDIIRKATMEMIENDLDMEIFRKAMKKYEADPRTHSLEDVEKELELR